MPGHGFIDRPSSSRSDCFFRQSTVFLRRSWYTFYVPIALVFTTRAGLTTSALQKHTGIAIKSKWFATGSIMARILLRCMRPHSDQMRQVVLRERAEPSRSATRKDLPFFSDPSSVFSDLRAAGIGFPPGLVTPEFSSSTLRMNSLKTTETQHRTHCRLLTSRTEGPPGPLVGLLQTTSPALAESLTESPCLVLPWARNR